MSTYLIDDQRVDQDSVVFTSALAAAHASRHRPICLCRPQGPDMYVARLGATFIVKRMPGTGSLHASACPSYEPPAEMSGLARFSGTAITELPDTGTTLLKLDFALSRRSMPCVTPCGGEATRSVESNSRGLTLRGLLHYLWDQAELNRWHPGFAGRRTWSTVRRHLLSAAEGKIVCGRPLRDVLYVPEAFFAERRAEIAARRNESWHRMARSAGSHQPLLLLLGELKKIAPTRLACQAVIRHMPDQTFVLEDALFRRTTVRFGQELRLWEASPTSRMLAFATFSLSPTGVPTIEELLLVPANAQWIPVQDVFELRLVDRLRKAGRRFTRCLRHDVATGRELPAVLLLDTPHPPTSLCLARPGSAAPRDESTDETHNWTWHVSRGAMPPFPALAGPGPEKTQCARIWRTSPARPDNSVLPASWA